LLPDSPCDVLGRLRPSFDFWVSPRFVCPLNPHGQGILAKALLVSIFFLAPIALVRNVSLVQDSLRTQFHHFSSFLYVRRAVHFLFTDSRKVLAPFFCFDRNMPAIFSLVSWGFFYRFLFLSFFRLFVPLFPKRNPSTFPHALPGQQSTPSNDAADSPWRPRLLSPAPSDL